LRGNQAFAAAFNKKRAEAEVAFQIRRLRESKGWSQKDLAKGGLQPTGDIGGRTRRIQESFTSAFACIAQVLDADVVVALVPRKAA